MKRTRDSHYELLISLVHSRATLKALVIGFRVGHGHPAAKAMYAVSLDRALVDGQYAPQKASA